MYSDKCSFVVVASDIYVLFVQFTFMNMRTHLQDGVLITKTQATDPPPAANEFFICGANVGLTTTLHVRFSSAVIDLRS